MSDRVFIITASVLVFASYLAGIGSGVESHEKEDIAAGVAHFVQDPKTGKMVFEYIKREKQ